ncbi:imidazole glycerol phosphate synthase subunit HisH [Pelosinus propionicus]|uniref:Imidazole glycerol phosphate synthase subunit HisH n=1 Tax=Pelosinus propionicus DSM 13327 TaxID=1123291 RepID=A0A1I4KLV2_9FIRM|nr:imidazole glycerol phosphate synthase subunit HisH [Pelosinus propionicus]SFL79427.1 glutamine amidotransferase [Pelosinus propionicus DSM 13327]
MIAIIDYGMGNLYSVEKALAKLGAKAQVTSEPEIVTAADKVVLPGVGAFGDCMENLKAYHMIDAIHEVVAKGTPFLSICLGLQVLFEGSEEDPEVKGLGLFPGMVRKIQAPALKIPHMGWNSISFAGKSPLFENIPQESYVYFVHSFHAVPEDASLITAVADYGGSVTAAVGRDNIQAVQFHPEKSGSIGLAMLANFKEMKL